jgi:glycosyltransferase 2 family protein
VEKKYIITSIKVLITFPCLYFIFSKVPFYDVLEEFEKFSFMTLIAVIFLTLSHLLLIGLRWRLILSKLDTFISYKKSLSFCFIGFGVSQALPSTIGGDVYRAIALRKMKNGLRTGVVSVFYDRLLGLLALGILAMPALFQYSDISMPPLPIYLTIVLALTIIMPFVFVKKYRYYLTSSIQNLEFLNVLYSTICSLEVVKYLQHRSFGKKTVIVLILMSLAVQILVCSVFAILISGLASTINLNMFFSIPLIIMFSLVPVSIAGWGLREAASVMILSGYGLPPEQAIAVGIMFGLTQLVVGLFGVALIPFHR